MSSNQNLMNCALLGAVYEGEANAVRKSLEEGANPNFKPKSCKSLMRLATEKSQTEIIKLLVTYGAVVDRDLAYYIFDEKTVEFSKELVVFIIEHKKDIKTLQLIFYYLNSVTDQDDPAWLEIFDLLLAHGLPINEFDDFHEWTLLQYACGGKLDFVRKLINFISFY